MRQLSPLRPDLHLLISRLTVLKQYIVLHPEKGSIAETMVRPLLNSIEQHIRYSSAEAEK